MVKQLILKYVKARLMSTRTRCGESVWRNVFTDIDYLVNRIAGNSAITSCQYGDFVSA